MSELFNYLTLPFLLAMFLAVNMGASGTSPAFSAAYGANVIKRSVIPGLFGVMVLAGALIAGEKVTLTLGSELLDQVFFTPLVTSIILLSVSMSLLLANLIGVPQSTSQSTVLSITGAALALDEFKAQTLFYEIIPAWFILPVASFIIMLFLTKFIFPLIRSRILTTDYQRLRAHPGLRIILILSSCYVAFSIGANNVANAAAPIASLTVNALGSNSIENVLPVIILSVLLVAPCFAIGSSLLGHKVTSTQGKDIVPVSPFQATIIAVIVASLLLLASVIKGIPTSLVQLNGAAFIALSLDKQGWEETWRNKTVKKFFLIWAIAPLFAFLMTYLIMTIVM